MSTSGATSFPPTAGVVSDDSHFRNLLETLVEQDKEGGDATDSAVPDEDAMLRELASALEGHSIPAGMSGGGNLRPWSYARVPVMLRNRLRESNRTHKLRLDDVPGEVYDWIFTHLESKKFPYPLAAALATKVSHQVTNSIRARQQQPQQIDDGNKSFTEVNPENPLSFIGISRDVKKEAFKSLSVLSSELLKSSPNLLSSTFDTLKPPSQSSGFDITKPLQSFISPFVPTTVTSLYSIRNGRKTMEDRHVVIHNLNEVCGIESSKQFSYYAVFDGHAGVEAATFSASHLHIKLTSCQAFKDGDYEEALRIAFKATDDDYLNRSALTSIKAGCTAVVCLKVSTEKVYFAWAGDSQAILVRDGRPLDLTPSHKPEDEGERERIVSLGGEVLKLDTWRVMGTLAVSRAIGDPDYKPYVTSEPGVVSLALEPSDDFIVLACDGLWDQLSPDDATSLVYEHLAQTDFSMDGSVSNLANAAQSVAQVLVENAQKEGSTDNITSIVVFLKSISSFASNTSNISYKTANNTLTAEDIGEEMDSQWSFLDQQPESLIFPSIASTPLSLNDASPFKEDITGQESVYLTALKGDFSTGSKGGDDDDKMMTEDHFDTTRSSQSTGATTASRDFDFAQSLSSSFVLSHQHLMDTSEEEANLYSIAPLQINSNRVHQQGPEELTQQGICIPRKVDEMKSSSDRPSTLLSVETGGSRNNEQLPSEHSQLSSSSTPPPPPPSSSPPNDSLPEGRLEEKVAHQLGTGAKAALSSQERKVEVAEQRRLLTHFDSQRDVTFSPAADASQGTLNFNRQLGVNNYSTSDNKQDKPQEQDSEEDMISEDELMIIKSTPPPPPEDENAFVTASAIRLNGNHDHAMTGLANNSSANPFDNTGQHHETNGDTPDLLKVHRKNGNSHDEDDVVSALVERNDDHFHHHSKGADEFSHPTSEEKDFTLDRQNVDVEMNSPPSFSPPVKDFYQKSLFVQGEFVGREHPRDEKPRQGDEEEAVGGRMSCSDEESDTNSVQENFVISDGKESMPSSRTATAADAAKDPAYDSLEKTSLATIMGSVEGPSSSRSPSPAKSPLFRSDSPNKQIPSDSARSWSPSKQFVEIPLNTGTSPKDTPIETNIYEVDCLIDVSQPVIERDETLSRRLSSPGNQESVRETKSRGSSTPSPTKIITQETFFEESRVTERESFVVDEDRNHHIPSSHAINSPARSPLDDLLYKETDFPSKTENIFMEEEKNEEVIHTLENVNRDPFSSDQRHTDNFDFLMSSTTERSKEVNGEEVKTSSFTTQFSSPSPLTTGTPIVSESTTNANNQEDISSPSRKTFDYFGTSAFENIQDSASTAFNLLQHQSTDEGQVIERIEESTSMTTTKEWSGSQEDSKLTSVSTKDLPSSHFGGFSGISDVTMPTPMKGVSLLPSSSPGDVSSSVYVSEEKTSVTEKVSTSQGKPVDLKQEMNDALKKSTISAASSTSPVAASTAPKKGITANKDVKKTTTASVPSKTAPSVISAKPKVTPTSTTQKPTPSVSAAAASKTRPVISSTKPLTTSTTRTTVAATKPSSATRPAVKPSTGTTSSTVTVKPRVPSTTRTTPSSASRLTGSTTTTDVGSKVTSSRPTTRTTPTSSTGRTPLATSSTTAPKVNGILKKTAASSSVLPSKTTRPPTTGVSSRLYPGPKPKPEVSAVTSNGVKGSSTSVLPSKATDIKKPVSSTIASKASGVSSRLYPGPKPKQDQSSNSTGDAVAKPAAVKSASLSSKPLASKPLTKTSKA